MTDKSEKQVQPALRVVVVSIFPDSFSMLTDVGISSRALENNLWTFATENPRDYAMNKHNRVDDRPYGGGPGMVMQAPPLRDAILAAKNKLQNPNALVVYMSPQGARLNQSLAANLLNQQLAEQQGRESISCDLILLCGRYEGIDERLIMHYVDYEISIGDYILSGGELAAMVVLDTLVRLIPGACGHEASAEQDSFSTPMLDHEQFTRPEEFEGVKVPHVLTSGDHKAIEQWRAQNALERTRLRRPDLLDPQ